MCAVASNTQRPLIRVAVLTTLVLASCGSAGVHHAAASLRSTNSTTASTTAVPSKWCVPISREAASARVMKLASEVAPTDTAHAKLVSWPERQAATAKQTSGPLHDPNFTPHTKFWAVEVRGSVTPKPIAVNRTYAWGVFDVDAQSGELRDISAGPPGSRSFWDSLPDHASDCTR
jgi:hypothetical protein